MPERVRITDVSPRDGLQNEPAVIATDEKVGLIDLLCKSGVDEIELTSLVSSKWVPQLGDAREVIQGVVRRLLDRHAEGRPRFSVLVPNERGLQGLLDAEAAIRLDAQDIERFYEEVCGVGGHVVDRIAVFTAASETFCQRNTNVSIAESFERIRAVFRLDASAHHTVRQVRGYISCCFACPFEGPIHPQKVAAVARKLITIGVNEIDLGDTIGAATVDATVHLLESLQKELGRTITGDWLTLHFHDTFGRATDCLRAALDLGVRSFDGSVAGLGGCPYASTPGRRAPGNISTETLVRTVHEAGFETGVDLERLAEAAEFARRIVAKARSSAGASGGGG
jgi:hydroxymethylglutaryl-CoA lyase